MEGMVNGSRPLTGLKLVVLELLASSCCSCSKDCSVLGMDDSVLGMDDSDFSVPVLEVVAMLVGRRYSDVDGDVIRGGGDGVC